jgi:hypothetical protein
MTIKPEYEFWRKRIEGQIRHTMNEHPEWFNLPDAESKKRCVSSMAKRIIGEIVAGILTGNNQPESCNGWRERAVGSDVQTASASHEVPGGIQTAGYFPILSAAEIKQLLSEGV